GGRRPQHPIPPPPARPRPTPFAAVTTHVRPRMSRGGGRTSRLRERRGGDRAEGVAAGTRQRAPRTRSYAPRLAHRPSPDAPAHRDAYDGGMTETAPAAPAAPAPHAAPAWVRDAICWQVYPLGFCGAPRHREDLTGETYGGADGENVVHRLRRLAGWLDHLVALGANVLLLNPIFDSVSHGYDTLDHRRIDPR